MKVPNKVIDAHVHLDCQDSACVDKAATALLAEVNGGQPAKVVLLALEASSHLALSSHEVARLAAEFPEIIPVMSVHPHDELATVKIEKLLELCAFRGIKLHPRLQQFDLGDRRVVKILHRATAFDLPVILDTFPYYPGYYPELSPREIHLLAEQAPQTKLVLAHACAHRIIDAVFLAKAHKNIYLDLSFSLLYFRGSSVIDDIGFAIRSLKGERILYGSDYPDRGLKETLTASLAVLETFSLPQEIMEKILFQNALQLFIE